MNNVEPVEYYRPPKPDIGRLKQLTTDIAKSKTISNGPVVRNFEETIRDYYGVRYALACGNCTIGLFLASRVIRMLSDAKEGILPSFTWSSTELALKGAGLHTLYTDIDRNTWVMLPVDRPKQVIMPVTTFGCAVEATKYEGEVLIDAAHAMGTSFDISGARGAVISFAPSKIITCGEGGILLTDDTSLAAKFQEMRDKYSRMSEFNAAMGLSQWEGLDAFIRDRRNRWQKYCQLLKSPQKAHLTNYTTAAFRIRNRDAIAIALKEKGIETRIYYKPLIDGLADTDQLYKEVLCLPNWFGCPTDKVLKALGEVLK